MPYQCSKPKSAVSLWLHRCGLALSSSPRLSSVCLSASLPQLLSLSLCITYACCIILQDTTIAVVEPLSHSLAAIPLTAGFWLRILVVHQNIYINAKMQDNRLANSHMKRAHTHHVCCCCGFQKLLVFSIWMRLIRCCANIFNEMESAHRCRCGLWRHMQTNEGRWVKRNKRNDSLGGWMMHEATTKPVRRDIGQRRTKKNEEIWK